jgi:hypothetical protein
LNINLRIEFISGESYDVSCTAGDIVRFESHFNISVAVLDTQIMFTHLLFLAWASETRRKVTDKPFEEWVDLVAGIEAVDSKK